MTYGWDDFGRKLRETDALGRTRQFVYDQHGNPVSVVDARGQLTTLTWGYGHQLTGRTAGTAVTTWTRNLLGQEVTAKSPAVTYTYGYDAAHRLTSVTDSRGTKTLRYTYSPGGLLLTMQDSHGNRTDYDYDPVGRLTGIWSPRGDLVSFLYDAGGRLVQKWFPNGITTQYTWNADNTLARVQNRAGTGATTIVSQHDYTYDGVGNRRTHTERVGATTTPHRYVYDALDRLIEVRNNTSSALLARYAYDPLGNRITKSDGVSTTAYLYDAANQLTELRQGSPSGASLGALTYDLNGNLIQKKSGATTTTLTYDALNRVTQVQKTGVSTQAYQYDDQGRRVRRTVGSTVVQYIYSGPDIATQYGTTWTAPTAIYTHGPGMDDPLIRTTSTATQYYHQDGLGSVVAVSGPGGTLDASARYDAWGVTLTATGTIPVYGYTGREPDPIGLVYYRARYYDPAAGRFVSRDPIGLDGGDINLYAYVGNNPVNHNDPDGLFVEKPFAGAANVLLGLALAKLTGQPYGIRAAGIDFALGAATSGLAAAGKLRPVASLAAKGAVALLKGRGAQTLTGAAIGAGTGALSAVQEGRDVGVGAGVGGVAGGLGGALRGGVRTAAGVDFIGEVATQIITGTSLTQLNLVGAFLAAGGGATNAAAAGFLNRAGVSRPLAQVVAAQALIPLTLAGNVAASALPLSFSSIPPFRSNLPSMSNPPATDSGPIRFPGVISSRESLPK
jgi:RHS repeat-associated protein